MMVELLGQNLGKLGLFEIQPAAIPSEEAFGEFRVVAISPSVELPAATGTHIKRRQWHRKTLAPPPHVAAVAHHTPSEEHVARPAAAVTAELHAVKKAPARAGSPSVALTARTHAVESGEAFGVAHSIVQARTQTLGSEAATGAIAFTVALPAKPIVGGDFESGLRIFNDPRVRPTRAIGRVERVAPVGRVAPVKPILFTHKRKRRAG